MRPLHAARGPFSALLLLAVLPAFAADPFEKEFGNDPAKVAEDDVDISLMNGDGGGSDSGRGPAPYMKGLGAPPARIGLITFYVRDSGNKQENTYRIYAGNYIYKTWSMRTINLKEGEVARLATELHDEAIRPLKEAFATVGSELLEPQEFLDTEAKRAAYDSFTLKHNFAERMYLAQVAKDSPSFRFQGAPEGYRVLELTTLHNVKSNKFQLATTGVGVFDVAEGAGHDLAKALGLDAVAFMYTIVQAQEKEIVMRAAGLYLFGPNPVPNKGQSLYWRGHLYSGTYLEIDEVPFVKADKEGNVVVADYKGYAIVAKALALRMAQHLKEKTGFTGKPRAVPINIVSAKAVAATRPAFDDLQPGARVWCAYGGKGAFYPGTIKSRTGSALSVEYEDGDREQTNVGACKLTPYSVGDKVECDLQGKGMKYPGEVTGIDGDKLTIHYDRGDEESLTASRCVAQR